METGSRWRDINRRMYGECKEQPPHLSLDWSICFISTLAREHLEEAALGVIAL